MMTCTWFSQAPHITDQQEHGVGRADSPIDWLMHVPEIIRGDRHREITGTLGSVIRYVTRLRM